MDAAAAHDPVRLDRIDRGEVEEGRPDQRRVDRQARPAPRDEIGADRRAELHRHRAAEDQERPGLGAIGLEPPGRSAGGQVDQRDGNQKAVEQEHRGCEQPRHGGGRQLDDDPGSVALLEQIGVGNTRPEMIFGAVQPLAVGLAVHLQDRVADSRTTALGRGRQALDDGRGADPGVGEGVVKPGAGHSEEPDRRREREDGPADEDDSNCSAHP